MQRVIGNAVLVFDPREQDTADLISGTYERAIQLARDMWGLEPPEDCRIYVMTSWLGFVFQSAPWAWRVLLAATFPFWCFRARRTWPYSAAWTERYGERVAIGVKPPRLLAQSDRSIGVRLFVEENDPKANVQHVTCHELVHACSARLRLPAWLNEGIAIVTVDRFLGRPTVREETLEYMKGYMPKAAPPTYRELSRMGLEAIAYHSARAYWLVRHLEETRPGFLKLMFLRQEDAKALEQQIVNELGMEPDSFWNDIDRGVVDYFSNKGV